jgi:hypothetical protein
MTTIKVITTAKKTKNPSPQRIGFKERAGGLDTFDNAALSGPISCSPPCPTKTLPASGTFPINPSCRRHERLKPAKVFHGWSIAPVVFVLWRIAEHSPQEIRIRYLQRAVGLFGRSPQINQTVQTSTVDTADIVKIQHNSLRRILQFADGT